MNRFEHFILGIGCGLILTSALVLADTARQFERTVNMPTDQRPTIPMCEKPLWERIKDGCP